MGMQQNLKDVLPSLCETLPVSSRSPVRVSLQARPGPPDEIRVASSISMVPSPRCVTYRYVVFSSGSHRSPQGISELGFQELKRFEIVYVYRVGSFKRAQTHPLMNPSEHF